MQEKLIKHIALYFDITARPFKNGVKFNVQSLDTDNIIELYMVCMHFSTSHIEIKRSGTGLVVIITEK